MGYDEQFENEYENIAQGCAGAAGAGCEGCPGCGEPQYLFDSPNSGKTVKVHYIGTLDDGTQFDSSYDRDEPLEFVCGLGMMIPGFDYAVGMMNPGDVVDVHLTPEEGYGMPRDAFIITVETAAVAGAEDLNVGDKVTLQDELGRPFPATVTAIEDGMTTFDCNHELAGKELNFRIELLEAI